VLAAITTDLRAINGNRGKLILFKLDDKTDTLEASVDEATYPTQLHLLKDDELVIVQAPAAWKMSADLVAAQGHAGVVTGSGTPGSAALRVASVSARRATPGQGLSAPARRQRRRSAAARPAEA
jgi:hypothetical protein